MLTLNKKMCLLEHLIILISFLEDPSTNITIARAWNVDCLIAPACPRPFSGRASMASLGGGEPPSSPFSTVDAFHRLLVPLGMEPVTHEVPKFIKKLDAVPEIALLEEPSIKIALALAERGLVGQFMGLWPSPKTTDDWIQRNWRSQLKHSVTCYPVGRGFFIFEFISKEDHDLIFRSGPYFMGFQGLYLNRWSPDFDPTVDVPKEVPV